MTTAGYFYSCLLSFFTGNTFLIRFLHKIEVHLVCRKDILPVISGGAAPKSVHYDLHGLPFDMAR